MRDSIDPGNYARHMPRVQRTMRVVIEGVGVIDIDRGLFTEDGNPRVRIDVLSDFDRYGVAPDGRRYEVENGDPGPGVVFVTGYVPDPEPTVSRETLKEA